MEVLSPFSRLMVLPYRLSHFAREGKSSALLASQLVEKRE